MLGRVGVCWRVGGLPSPPVLILTDRHASSRAVHDIVRDVLAAGARWIVVREKDLGRDALTALVADIVAQAAPYAAAVLVAGAPDDAVAAARQAGAAGVHLPQDGDPSAARAALGGTALVGQSGHDGAEIARAQARGADYVTLSPVFASASKPGYGPALGVARWAVIAAAVDVPVLALGGITSPDDVAACRAAGAAGVAVMGAVWRAGDPGAVVAALIAAWDADGNGSRGSVAAT